MDEKSKVVKVPEPTILDSGRRIWNYTIGFLKLEAHEGYENAILLGSGVLVRVDDAYAILTAQHVVEVIPKNELVGLILTNKKETPKLDTNHVEFLEIARGDIDSKGPDIALIVLPPQVAKSLEARKSFYNLTIRKDDLLANSIEEKQGLWFAQGFVEERTKIDTDIRKPATVKSFCIFSAAGGPEVYEVSNEFDYYKFPIDTELQDSSPKNYGGISGGGLWQVILKENENKGIEIDEVILRGVNFYQFPLVDGKTGLRCHGYKSVYDTAYEVLSAHAL